MQLRVRLKRKNEVSTNFLAAVSAKCARCQRNVLFLQQSSVCRAGLHAGVINNDGGWLDVTRQGRKDFFIRSNKNGVESLGYDSNNNNDTDVWCDKYILVPVVIRIENEGEKNE